MSSNAKLLRRHGASRAVAVILMGVAAQLAVIPRAHAQALTARESTTDARPAIVRATYGRMMSGERATYELRLAGRGVGTGSLEVLGTERVEGYNTLHARLQVSGGVLFAKVNDKFDSWIDPERYFSRRFVQDQHELTTKRYRDYLLAPEQKTFRQVDSGENGTMTTTEPLDDVSFLFYARTLPLRVGDVDTIPRYFKPGHDVILRVLRKERVTVPAGTFETIVVQPTITNAGGLFGQGGHAELYFTDDAARTLVMLKSKVPVVGSLSLHLKEFRSGQ
jgi:hypothetical protein